MRSGIAIESVDGAHLRNITISNISMVNVNTPIFIRLGHRGLPKWQTDPVPGSIDGVLISNVVASGALYPSVIAGMPDHPIRNVQLSHIQIKTAEGGTPDQAEVEVPELPGHYPEATMFGTLPAHGLYCRHAGGLRLTAVECISEQDDARPLLLAGDVQNLVIDGIAAYVTSRYVQMFRFVDVRGGWLRNCAAGHETDVFLDVRGDDSQRIVVAHNDLRGGQQVVRKSEEVPPASAHFTQNID